MIREGMFLVWRDQIYPANTDGARLLIYTDAPAEGFRQTAPGRYERDVTDEDVNGAYVSTIGTWRGVPVKALYEHGDHIRIEYTGGRADVAESLGMERVDKGVYQIWTTRQELLDLHETALS
ncbi:hypothetical protein [Actinocatenispora rupis]|uniref:Uncharacterized protein n=1 Tax=Actinocatenispora rupis TaxID=519421 RepID=A0A8J3J688_9ACTN|nr:hypothetical protein [Actinocatenispora rupis]GID09348.1 hypothetical protein Aru02nite_02370 [Actinocatenispora rupis]